MPILSKLEAVNIILKAIEEDKVSSLEAGLPDAEHALETLEEVSRDIQAIGWHCNTENEVLLTRDGDNKIALPNSTLNVDADGDSSDLDVVQRGEFLYDRENKTFTFDSDVYVALTYLLDYEDLPYRLALYIALEAAGRHQMRSLGAAEIDKSLQRDISTAKSRLEEAEEQVDDANVLRDSDSVRAVAWRNNPRALR